MAALFSLFWPQTTVGLGCPKQRATSWPKQMWTSQAPCGLRGYTAASISKQESVTSIIKVQDVLWAEMCPKSTCRSPQPRTSEWGCIGRWVFKEGIEVNEVIRWALIPQDWHPHKRTLGHKHVQRDSCVRQGEGVPTPGEPQESPNMGWAGPHGLDITGSHIGLGSQPPGHEV